MIRIFSILLLAGVFALSACSSDSSSSPEDTTAQADEPSVHVQDFRLVEGSEGERQVMGTLQNGGSEAIESAQVQVALYDANNVQIETMNVAVSDVPATGAVDFKQSLDTDKEVHGARVKSVLVM